MISCVLVSRKKLTYIPEYVYRTDPIHSIVLCSNRKFDFISAGDQAMSCDIVGRVVLCVGVCGRTRRSPPPPADAGYRTCS